jgi:hypothetical protein
MLFVAATLPLAKRGPGVKVVAQHSSSFNRPGSSVVVFCSRVFKGQFCHGAMQNLYRCNAKDRALQCKGRIFDLPLQCKSKNYIYITTTLIE